MKKKENQEEKKAQSWGEHIFAIPALDLIRNYKLEWLKGDLLAGLIICAVTIPAALAYGKIAGLHRINGIYASLAAMLVYAFFGTSRRLIIGAEAAVAILVASSLHSLLPSGAGDAHYLGLAVVQAIMVGAILIIAGISRIGFIAHLFPETVVVGFINGIGLVIIFSQLGDLFGIELKNPDFFPRMAEFFTHLWEANGLTFAIGSICLASLLLSRRFSAKIPEPVFMVIIATIIVFFFGLETKGIKIIGDIPHGLPNLAIPEIETIDIFSLIPTSLGIALISYADIIITGRAFATKPVYQADPNKELYALGIANLANGLAQGFTVGASHSRTAINDMYNGKTQFSGLFGAVFLGLFLITLTRFLKHVPVVALSAIVVAAGISLLRPKEIYRIFRRRRVEGYVTIITSLAVLLLGIMTGILISVAIAIILVLHRLSVPHETISRKPRTFPGLLIYRFGAPLLFFNTPDFINRVQEIIDTATPPVTFLLLNAEAMVEIDWEAVKALKELQHSLRSQGIELGICESKGYFAKVLKESRFPSREGVTIYPSVAKALEDLKSKGPAKKGAES